ncbi:MAG: hypothetical protein MK212_07035 [Saprospiraceae bacterium]|nr:hypothetical protein [Saprospiraceae bacterium]
MKRTPNLYFIITFLIGIAILAKSIIGESKVPDTDMQFAQNYVVIEPFLFEISLGIIITVKSGILLLLKKGLKRNLLHLVNLTLDIIALLMLEAGVNMTAIPRRYYSFDTFSTFSTSESNISFLLFFGTLLFIISQILSIAIIFKMISNKEKLESFETLDGKINRV